MKQNHTDINIVLDRSGSMEHIATDTIGGYNEFLKRQQEAPGTATFTLNQFDDVYERVTGPIDIKEVQPLTRETFVPRNTTALLDAIGRTINDVGERLAALPEADRPAKVILVIITDGYENASHEFRHSQVQAMIERQRTQFQWEFVYLGANQDAILVARGLNIPMGNAIKYAASGPGTSKVFTSVSSNMVGLRSGTKADMSFTAKDYADQTEELDKQ